jgi:hypothetical protein
MRKAMFKLHRHTNSYRPITVLPVIDKLFAAVLGD